TFILRAHILSWLGDIPALTKVMCTTGHNSYKACRFCSIRGICCKENQHIYFPLKPPKCLNGSSRKHEVQEKEYCSSNASTLVWFVFKDNQLSNSEYTIPNSHSEAFKAEHWLNWIVLYLIPLLQGNLPERHLNGWAKFVHAVKLCLKHKIDTAELLEINQLFCEFVTHYEKEYLQNNSSRLPAALISYHYLLHIYRYTNLQNQITMWNQFSLLQFKADINKKLFETSSEKSLYHSENRIFIIEDIEKKLYLVALNYYINKT
ncbi:26331_t:CDS:2, partial [Gigaspora rosea]